MRYPPKWLVNENIKLIKERKIDANKTSYEKGCSNASKAICQTVWKFIKHPHCIDEENGKCPII